MITDLDDATYRLHQEQNKAVTQLQNDLTILALANAARALLLPGIRGGNRRTPFWLQRLRAKELLSIVRDFQEYPLIAETYRDCLRDVLDLEHLLQVVEGVQTGEIRVVEVETIVPSPVAASLLYDFVAFQMYEGICPRPSGIFKPWP